MMMMMMMYMTMTMTIINDDDDDDGGGGGDDDSAQDDLGVLYVVTVPLCKAGLWLLSYTDEHDDVATDAAMHNSLPASVSQHI